MEESVGCQYDRLEVLDGIGSDAPVLGVYCGETFKAARASGSTLSVSFISDSVINSGGFVIYWTADEGQ